jgi:hypothetical protein
MGSQSRLSRRSNTMTMTALYPINPTQEQAWEAGRAQGRIWAERRDDAALAELIESERAGSDSTYIGAGFLAGLEDIAAARREAAIAANAAGRTTTQDDAS